MHDFGQIFQKNLLKKTGAGWFSKRHQVFKLCFINYYKKNLVLVDLPDLRSGEDHFTKGAPGFLSIWTPDFWTSSRPEFEFWGRLDQ
jgi:hypothetical protein